MARVFLKNIKKIYPNGTQAVSEANLEVKDKEFVVLVGPSGCGKSTTLRMIAGLEDITDGELYIGEKFVNDIPPKDRDIAMVFQNYALYPHMTVYDNIAFGLKLRKYPKNVIKERVEEAANILGIQKLLFNKPKELSGGQKQRVAVGRAIVRKPQVFLFDEPLSNLDAKLRVDMRAELSKLHTRLQTTMIYVTHDQTEAMTMGERIVVMKDGYIQQIDTPLELYHKPDNKFVAGFIGSPPMNFLQMEVLQEKNDIWLDEGSFRLKIPKDYKDIVKPYINKKIFIGIRPEHIYDKLLYKESAPETTVKLTVEVVEPLGSEILIYTSSAKNQITAKVDTRTEVHVNEDIEMVFDMSKIHLFDTETEKAIL
ncbi:MAG: sn-glycerol-3-phosphate ABC transporter ATP-binding protein UgpC [Spirochaetes bacterium]|nr:sn-glycerol-3-phosphate ABC transporter ATP-binding protein UgpC [Spirochaetota bacterium]